MLSRLQTFDPKCYDLAAHFLPEGTEAQKRALASEIQYAIENFYPSILSEEPDGSGFYYGYAPGDLRRIDVRREGLHFTAYVAGDPIRLGCLSKQSAELAAIDWMRAHPEGGA
jgi:hypothetical protein